MLRRQIPGTGLYDYMGLYPFLCCENWDYLEDDLRRISHQGVAVSLVTDPFCDIHMEKLRSLFPDRLEAFKRHYVSELRISPDIAYTSHHRRKIRRAASIVGVEAIAEPRSHLETWNTLYQNLIRRHSIKGLLSFSAEHFTTLFNVPGIRIHSAMLGGSVVGMSLWFVQNRIAYWHLAAYSEEGYNASASYALVSSARELLKLEADWLCLGGTATKAGKHTGLDYFKRGFSTETRTTYLCGRIFNPTQYRELSRHQ